LAQASLISASPLHSSKETPEPWLCSVTRISRQLLDMSPSARACFGSALLLVLTAASTGGESPRAAQESLAASSHDRRLAQTIAVFTGEESPRAPEVLGGASSHDHRLAQRQFEVIERQEAGVNKRLRSIKAMQADLARSARSSKAPSSWSALIWGSPTQGLNWSSDAVEGDSDGSPTQPMFDGQELQRLQAAEAEQARAEEELREARGAQARTLRKLGKAEVSQPPAKARPKGDAKGAIWNSKSVLSTIALFMTAILFGVLCIVPPQTYNTSTTPAKSTEEQPMSHQSA